ncbi:Hypothetical protein, putative, partial [Bodo saltans]
FAAKMLFDKFSKQNVASPQKRYFSSTRIETATPYAFPIEICMRPSPRALSIASSARDTHLKLRFSLNKLSSQRSTK